MKALLAYTTGQSAELTSRFRRPGSPALTRRSPGTLPSTADSQQNRRDSTGEPRRGGQYLATGAKPKQDRCAASCNKVLEDTYIGDMGGLWLLHRYILRDMA